MYRALVMFPKAASEAETDTLIDGIASSFRGAAGLQSISRSVGPLMGPGARTGDVGCILEADFATLDDVMTALHAEGFHDVKAATESGGTTIFLFELSDV